MSRARLLVRWFSISEGVRPVTVSLGAATAGVRSPAVESGLDLLQLLSCQLCSFISYAGNSV